MRGFTGMIGFTMRQIISGNYMNNGEQLIRMNKRMFVI